MGVRVLYDPKDFLELQTGGPCSLVPMEVDNRSRKSSTCLYLSRAFQPLSPSPGWRPNPRGRCSHGPHSPQELPLEVVFQLPLQVQFQSPP